MKINYQVISIIFAVVLCDQYTKTLVVNNLMSQINDFYRINDFFNIVLVYNFGISFGFFGKYQLNQYIFVLFSLLIILTLSCYYYFHRQHYCVNNLIFVSFIIGGAIGNILDRLIYGAVIDFLDFHFKNYHYPAFNLADSAIILGAFGILFLEFFAQKNKKSKAH